MPKVGNKSFAYSRAGRMKARIEAAKQAAKKAKGSWDNPVEIEAKTVKVTPKKASVHKMEPMKITGRAPKYSEHKMEPMEIKGRVPKKSYHKGDPMVITARGSKPPPLPKNWRSLPKNDKRRVAFREWYKSTRVGTKPRGQEIEVAGINLSKGIKKITAAAKRAKKK